MGIADTKSLHSSIVWIGSKNSLMFCSKWILGHETHQCVRSWVCTDICQLKLIRTLFFEQACWWEKVR